MMVPWARRLRKIGVAPRFLADDMFARCSAPKHVEEPLEHLQALTEAVVEATLDYIKNMGGNAQVRKCAILASSAELRAKLRGMKWGPKEEAIPIVTDARDLGAHLSASKRPRATTLKIKDAEAAPIARRIVSMKLDTSRRVRALKSIVPLNALCGVEATQLPDETVKQLQAAVLDAGVGQIRDGLAGSGYTHRNNAETDPFFF